MARRRCHWISTIDEVFDAGKYTGLRWLDSASTPHLSLHPLSADSPLARGENVEVHYE